MDSVFWIWSSGIWTLDFWKLLYKNGNSELPAAWHMRLHLQDKTQENTEQEIILIEEYCEKGIQDESDVTILCYMY